MKKLIVIALLFVTMNCFAEAVFLPMASLDVHTTNSQEIDSVWNKLRIYLITNGFAFAGNTDENSKSFALISDQDLIVTLEKNLKLGHVNVVFLHLTKSSFGQKDEETFKNLKASVEKAADGRVVEDIVPFKLAQ
jgi:hypothetical protein